MSLGSRKNTYNLDQLTKMFQIIAKLQYKQLFESIVDEVEPPKSHMDRFIISLQKKVSLAFNNTVEFVRWLSLSGRDTVKPEEFYFGVQFFSSSASFVDTMLLFQQLDENKDGVLDVNELTWLLQNDPNKEKALSYKYEQNEGAAKLCFKNT